MQHLARLVLNLLLVTYVPAATGVHTEVAAENDVSYAAALMESRIAEAIRPCSEE